MIGPVFEKLSEQPEYAGVGFYKVDVDEASVSNGLETVVVLLVSDFVCDIAGHLPGMRHHGNADVQGLQRRASHRNHPRG